MTPLNSFTKAAPLHISQIHPRRREMIAAAAAQVDGCREGGFLVINREGEKWDFWLTPYQVAEVAGWRIAMAHCSSIHALCRMGLDWKEKMGVGQGHAFAWVIDDEGYPLEFLGLLYGGDVWEDLALQDACGLTAAGLISLSASQTQKHLLSVIAAQKGGI
jgi:hypothetical protein